MSGDLAAERDALRKVVAALNATVGDPSKFVGVEVDGVPIGPFRAQLLLQETDGEIPRVEQLHLRRWTSS